MKRKATYEKGSDAAGNARLSPFRLSAAIHAFFHPISSSEVQANIESAKEQVRSIDETMRSTSRSTEEAHQACLEFERIQREINAPPQAASSHS